MASVAKNQLETLQEAVKAVRWFTGYGLAGARAELNLQDADKISFSVEEFLAWYDGEVREILEHLEHIIFVVKDTAKKV